MRASSFGVVCWMAVSAAQVLPAADAVDAYLSSFIQRKDIPGLSVAVTQRGKLVKAAGYGIANLELGVPATANSIYEIGSISKQFAAEAIVMLADEGKLSLDDLLSRYVPGTPAAWKDVTIRHILSHQSGMADWDGKGTLSYRREYTPKEYIDIVAASPLNFAPGEKADYTSAAYPFLGLVVQAVSGKPYEEFVTERIFKRAGMGTARFKHPEDVVPNRSGAYVGTRGSYQHGEVLRPRIIAPSGGIMASVLDFAAWDAALLDGRILKPETIALMERPVLVKNGQPGMAGLGWFEKKFHGQRMVLHNGSTLTGFSGVVYRYPEAQLMVIVLCNVDRWNAVNVAAEHVAGLYEPGVSISSLKPAAGGDPNPARSRALLDAMRDFGSGAEPELMAPNMRGGSIPKERRMALAEHFKSLKKVEFLEQDGAAIRFRLEMTNGEFVFYSLFLTPEGKIRGFLYEAD